MLYVERKVEGTGSTICPLSSVRIPETLGCIERECIPWPCMVRKVSKDWNLVVRHHEFRHIICVSELHQHVAGVGIHDRREECREWGGFCSMTHGDWNMRRLNVTPFNRLTILIRQNCHEAEYRGQKGKAEITRGLTWFHFFLSNCARGYYPGFVLR